MMSVIWHPQRCFKAFFFQPENEYLRAAITTDACELIVGIFSFGEEKALTTTLVNRSRAVCQRARLSGSLGWDSRPAVIRM